MLSMFHVFVCQLTAWKKKHFLASFLTKMSKLTFRGKEELDNLQTPKLLAFFFKQVNIFVLLQLHIRNMIYVREFWQKSYIAFIRFPSIYSFGCLCNAVQYTVTFEHGPIFYNITYRTPITLAQSESNFRITTDTPYLTCKDELWGVYCEDLKIENWKLTTVWWYHGVTWYCTQHCRD